MFENRLDHSTTQRRYAIFIAPEEKPIAKIKVIGVGNGGCNAINDMISRGLSGVEFIAVNTDAQNLLSSISPNKIQIGAALTKGLGSGGNVDLGRKAAEEDKEKIYQALEGAEMVFVATGLGGGTGTGASPVVAGIAKSTGALVVAVVTKPFRYEGEQKIKTAEKGIHELKEVCDCLITIPNDNIGLVIDTSKVSAFDAYDVPNEVLFNAVKGISDVILKNGKINVDFADVKSVLRDSGEALMGIGRASGQNKVVEAVNKAVSSPLLEEMDLRSCHSVLVNFTGSDSMSFAEVQEAMQKISEMVNPNAFKKFGLVKDDSLKEEVMVTIIATGYNKITRLNKTRDDGTELKLLTEELPAVLPTATVSETLNFDLEIGTYDPNDIEKYDIPTIMRVKGMSNAKSANNSDLLNSEDENLLENIRKNKSKENDEEDASKFLRKLMD